MIYAYLVEDVRALSDLFKAGVGPKKSAQGAFTAYHVRHPELRARRALVLCGIPKSGLQGELPVGVAREIRVDTQDGELSWYTDEGVKQPLEVSHVAHSPTLTHLIAPVPWLQEPEHGAPIVFWLRDAALMPELVRRSLYLNNDRIQLARVSHEDQQVVLLRVEAPSYYLITWALEQDPDKLTLYYPMGDSPGLLVQWGVEHPLAELWRRAWLDHGEAWLFFPADGPREVVPKPEWTSIYELADFSLQISPDELWEPLSAAADRFEVALRLTPRHEPAPIEVLALREQERPRIERYLALSDQEELERLEISAQQDTGGARWYFIREKLRGDGTTLMEFGGIGFARYKGFDNLFLPANLVLEPQLRRDQYKKLFKLEPHTLTFVLPVEGDDPREMSARQVSVKRRSFEPLAHFVDHIVHFDQAALQEALTSSVFDLDVYRHAPSRAGLGRTERAERPEPSLPLDKAKPSDEDNARRAALAAQRAAQRQQRPAATEVERLEVAAEVVGSSSPTELDLLETRLERELLRHGPETQRWIELLQVKHHRQKWADVIASAIEGLWTMTFPDGEQAEAFDPATARAFQTHIAHALTQLQDQSAELVPVAALFGSAGGGDEHQQLNAIIQASAALRPVEAKLNKKLRWLAWRGILQRTGDTRAQEGVREAILNDLNQKGLETHDSPLFLRERILKDPDLDLDERDEEGDNASYVLQNIEVIEQAILQLRTLKVRAASLASLSRIMGGMGLHARSRDLIQAALDMLEADAQRIAAGKAVAGESWGARVIAAFRAAPAGTRPERWHVWVALNAWLIFQRVEPQRAEEAQQVYLALFEQLAPYEKEDLRKTQESLETRIGQSNVAEFLAADSRSFFSSRDLPDEMGRVVRGLQAALRERREQQVNDLVARGVRLATRELTENQSPSMETVARLILEMVEILRKLKWEREQRPIELFEGFVRSLPREPATPDVSRLYFAVLHCAATRALMDLGREKDAMVMLVDTLRWVGQDYMQVLDFVDLVKKEVLLAIELAPRNQRTEALRYLMAALVEQERMEIGQDPDHPGQGFEMPFQAYELVQMIDHTLEAAISNEKLVLRRLRDYEEREEGRIRYWVQRDQPAAHT